MSLTYDLVPDRAPQIGLIVLQADESLERDMQRLLPVGSELLVSRVPSGSSVTQESLQEMGTVLTGAAALFPRGVEFAAVGYGCTSGTAQIGIEQIEHLVCGGTATSHVTEPVSAIIAACRHLNVHRIGLISPYIESVSDRLRLVLGEAGITVTAFASFDEAVEARVVRIAPESIAHAAIEIGQANDCDAVFLSCTNLRTLDVIETVETAINMPVLSSNQVLAWHLSQLTGLAAPETAPGRLFQV